ncbi:hypothetical protein D3C86_1636120 [compost metagenome]
MLRLSAKIRLLQGLQSALEIVDALKMYQRQRLFGLHARGARRHPGRRIKKQRLGLDPGLRATCMEQAFANLETAAGMGV